MCYTRVSHLYFHTFWSTYIKQRILMQVFMHLLSCKKTKGTGIGALALTVIDGHQREEFSIMCTLYKNSSLPAQI